MAPAPTKVDIRGLDDLELTKAFQHLAQTVPDALHSEWERQFARDIGQVFVDFGRLTWRQRESARDILIRFLGEVERRKLLQPVPEKPKRKRRSPTP